MQRLAARYSVTPSATLRAGITRFVTDLNDSISIQNFLVLPQRPAPLYLANIRDCCIVHRVDIVLKRCVLAMKSNLIIQSRSNSIPICAAQHASVQCKQCQQEPCTAEYTQETSSLDKSL